MLETKCIRRWNRHGNQSGIQSTPKRLYKIETRWVDQEQTLSGLESRLQISGDRASFGVQVSIRQNGIGGHPVSQEDIGNLVGLMISPPPQHIKKHIVRRNNYRRMCDHKCVMKTGALKSHG